MSSPPAPLSGWIRVLFFVEGLSWLGLALLSPAILSSETHGRGMGAVGLVVIVGAWALGSLLVGVVATLVALAKAPRAKLTRVMTVVHAPPALALLGLGGWTLWERYTASRWSAHNESFIALTEQERWRDADVYLREHPGWEIDCSYLTMDHRFAPTLRHAADAAMLLRHLQARGLTQAQLQAIGLNGPESAAALYRERLLTRRDLESMLRWGDRLDAEHVDSIVALGIDINAADGDGRTALMLSRGDLLQHLLALGADPRRRDRWGQTAMSYAESAHDYFTLSRAGLDVNERDKNGATPLARAERSNDEEAKELLLRELEIAQLEREAAARVLEQDAAP